MLKKLIIGLFSVLFFAVILQSGFTALAMTEAEIQNSLTQGALNRYGNRFNAPFLQSGGNIDLQTLAVEVSEVDLSLSGINGLDINIVRRYNSQRTATELRSRHNNMSMMANLQTRPMFWYTYVHNGVTLGIWVAFDFERDVIDSFRSTVDVINRHRMRDQWNQEHVLHSSVNVPTGNIELRRATNVAPTRMVEWRQHNIYMTFPNNNIDIGHSWSIDVPNIFVLPYSRNWGTATSHYARATLPLGQVLAIEYTINRDGPTMRVSSAEVRDDRGEHSIVGHATSVSHTAGFTYQIRITDSSGVQYFFENNSTNLNNSGTLWIRAIIDRYGNIIRYQNVSRNGYDITDTMGRRILVRPTGITVNNEQIIRYQLDLIRDNVRDPHDLLKTINQRTLTVRRYESRQGANTTFSDTQYIMRAREFYTRPTRWTFYNHVYHLERIVYPTGGYRVFSYTPQSRVTPLPGSGAASYFGYRVASRSDFNNGVEQNRYTYSYRVLSTNPLPGDNALRTTQTRIFDNVATEFTYDSFGRLTRVYNRHNGSLIRNQENNYGFARERNAPIRWTRTYENNIRVSYVRTNFDSANRPLYERFGPANNTGLQRNWEYDHRAVANPNRFSLVTMSEYQQDANTWIRTRNTLSPCRRNIIQSRVYEVYRGVQTLKSTTEFDYNDNGTIHEVRVFPADGEIIRTVYEYWYSGTGPFSITVKTYGAMVDGVSTNISVRRYFDFLGRLVDEIDANGNHTRFEYDLQNRITRQINPDGTSTVVNYDMSNNRITITNRNALGQTIQQTRRNHDQLGRLTSVYAYEGNNRFVRLGSVEYDNIGRRIRETAYRDAANFVRETFAYDALGRITAREIFDNSTRLERITFTHELDAGASFGLRNRRVTTRYTGDEHFRHPTSVSIIDAKGRNLSTTLHHPTTNAVLDQQTNVFDFAGNLLSTRGGRARLHNVDSARIVYNHMNQPIRKYNAYGHFRTFNYDNIGRLISESDFYGRLTHYVYDNAGRLIQVRTPFQGNIYSTTNNYFDANGNLIRTRQQNNRPGTIATFSTVEYRYDNRNRLTHVIQHDGNNRYYTQYAFDDGFNMTRVFTGLTAPINPANVHGRQTEFAVHTYVYDRLGRLIQYTDPMGLSETYRHDLFGNVTWRQNRDGSTITATFNAFSQPVEIVANYDDWIINAYSVNGLRTGMADSNGITTYTYDELGRLATEGTMRGDQPVIGRVYTYAIDGARESFRLTAGGAVLIFTEYQHDRLGRLTQVNNANGNVSYQYNRNGRVTRREVDGIVSTFSYNHGELMTSMDVDTGNSTTSFHRNLTYNLDGNIQRVQGWNSQMRDIVDNQYTYDGLGRLIRSSEGQEVNGSFRRINTDFRFDAFGNRIEQNRAGEITRYTYDLNNQLLSERRTAGNTTYINSFIYDPNGNMIFRHESQIRPGIGNESVGISLLGAEGHPNVWEFRYDGFNRLTSVQNGGMIATYAYDGNNLRQSKTVNGQTLNHIWDGMHIVAERGNLPCGTPLNATYIRSTQLMFGIVNGDMQRYTFDHAGSVVHLLDSNRQRMQHYVFDAFGNQLNDSANNSTIHNPFRFRGDGYFDNETGFVYLRNRFYDPSIGRFITEDPARWGQNRNWYRYASQNPIRFMDPLGLWDVPTHERMTHTAMSRIAANNPVLANFYIYHANQINVGNRAVDTWPYKALNALNQSAQSKHFNRTNIIEAAAGVGDSRIEWANFYMDTAVEIWTAADAVFYAIPEALRRPGSLAYWTRRNARMDALYTLGRGLHSIQDYEAHGDIGVGYPVAIHGLTGFDNADNPDLDWGTNRRQPLIPSFQRIRYNISIDMSEAYLEEFYQRIGMIPTP